MSKWPKRSLLAIIAGLLISIATLLAIGILRNKEVERSTKNAIAPQTYTLVLADESQAPLPWLTALRHRNDSKIAVSGYADDTPESVLQRLPWLLQPGVDTLLYDPALAGRELIDSLKQALALSSPTTVLVVYGDK